MCLAKGKFLTDAFYGNRNPGGKEVQFHVHRNTVQKEEWRSLLFFSFYGLEKRKGMDLRLMFPVFQGYIE